MRNNKQTAILAVVSDKEKFGKKVGDASKKDLYTICRPNTGLQVIMEITFLTITCVF